MVCDTYMSGVKVVHRVLPSLQHRRRDPLPPWMLLHMCTRTHAHANVPPHTCEPCESACACKCVRVCRRMRICVRACARVRTRVCNCVQARASPCKPVRVSACMQVCAYVGVCMRASARACISACMRAYMLCACSVRAVCLHVRPVHACVLFVRQHLCEFMYATCVCPCACMHACECTGWSGSCSAGMTWPRVSMLLATYLQHADDIPTRPGYSCTIAMDGRTDACTGGRTDRRADACKDGRTD